MDTCQKITLGLALAGCSSLCLSEPLRSESASHGAEDARYLLQDNDEQLRAQMEALRLRQLEREQNISPPPSAPPVEPTVDCLPLRALRLTGVTLLSRRELATIRLPHTACLSVAQLQEILQQLNRLYLERGFIAARVLPEPVRNGVMTLRVIEGTVEGFEHAPSGVTGLFPGMLGHPLNLRDLEQGLDQANRLPSAGMRAEVAPGHEPGASIIRLTEERGPPWRSSLSLDNRGYDATGRRTAAVDLSRDNPSGHFDFLSLGLSHSLNHGRFSRSASLFYSLPYGYWTLTTFAAQSAYLNTQKLRYHTVALSGDARQAGARLERVLTRSQTRIDSSYLQLSHKRVQNFFLGSLQQINSPTLTLLEFGLDRLSLRPAGVWSLEAALQQGMPWLGANRDSRLPYADMPRAQFSKLKLSASLHQGWRAAGSVTLDSRLIWQGSRQRLPAIEQIELTDPGLVRGFRHNSLSGETGWAWHNTLSHTLALGAFSATPRLALDLGRLSPRAGGQTLAGGGAGLSLSQSGVMLDLEYSRPLYQPNHFVGEAHQLLARLNWQF